jgi:hypothetical protein
MTEDLHDGDDALPKHLTDAARAYNAPPRTIPREAMWAAIARARSGVVGNLPDRIASREPRARRMRWQWAVAAGLLLSIGYATGRMTSTTTPAVTTADVVDRAPSVADAITATSHFARAELILTQFRADAQTTSADTAFTRWARQLLGDTRLLLDSPAAVDASRRSLLQDLELILIQITRSSRSNDAEDLKLTSDALRDSGLLPKLRAIVPSGTNPRT